MFSDVTDPELLRLIRRLSGITAVSSTFYLAGGTALAFHIGHRKSIDLDFFSPSRFSSAALSEMVVSLGGRMLLEEEGTLHSIIDDVKTSLLYYPYPVLYPFTKIAGVNIASVGDIACMKAVAISQRGEKKDFYDMVEVLKIYRPQELKAMILNKYGARRINCYHILRSLFYFEDAEDSPDPVSLNNTTWETVKAYLLAREEELTREWRLSTLD
jgi:hypothetical protein